MKYSTPGRRRQLKCCSNDISVVLNKTFQIISALSLFSKINITTFIFEDSHTHTNIKTAAKNRKRNSKYLPSYIV